MRRFIALFWTAGLLLSLCGCDRKPAPGATTEPVLTTEQSAVSDESTAASQPSTEPLLQPADPEPTARPEPIARPDPNDSEFVPVKSYIPDILVELKYASEDNFTGQRIYSFQGAFLRYGTVRKLLLAQDILKTQGLGLKLWDGYRPVSAQFVLWEVCPDPRYVANPQRGFSSHSRGNTVDVTLVDEAGQELPMPTGFDDFSALADRDYSDCSEESRQNALLLQTAMEEAGFQGYFGEWWHFSDTDQYPVEEKFTPIEEYLGLALGEEYITLRTQPNAESDELLRIPKNGIMRVYARHGAFLLVSFDGYLGYVLESCTQVIE